MEIIILDGYEEVCEEVGREEWVKEAIERLDKPAYIIEITDGAVVF